MNQENRGSETWIRDEFMHAGSFEVKLGNKPIKIER